MIEPRHRSEDSTVVSRNAYRHVICQNSFADEAGEYRETRNDEESVVRELIDSTLREVHETGEENAAR